MADVVELVRKIDERDIDRIKDGLQNIGRKLQRVEASARHKDVLDLSGQLVLFEALCCEAFLADRSSVEQYFQGPFVLIQTNRRLKITHYIPAATIFLFDDNNDRRTWATYTWSKYKAKPTEGDFSFAIRDPLLWKLQSTFDVVPDQALLQRLWYGMSLIVDNLDNDLVTHSLRAIDIDVFRLALEHLQFEGQSFRFLLQTIQKLIDLAPSVFWDSMGAISPTTFIEQVFNNQQYDKFIEGARENKDLDFSAMGDMLAWIKPFMTSLQTLQQARACRSLNFQLLDRLQSHRFPLHARLACKHAGFDVLAATLRNCNKADTALSHVGRVVAAETLEVTSDYIKDVINVPSLPSEDKRHKSCADTCIKIIKNALALECKSLRTDQDVLKRDQDLPDGFNTYSPAIWDAVVQGLHPRNTEVARAALVAINDLTGLEKFKVNTDERYAKEKSSFNVKLGRLTHLVCQILERINDFDAEDLDRLFQHADTATALVSSLFSSDTNLYEAGVNLIKNLSFESARREAIGHLLKIFFETTLNAVSWTIKRIARDKTFACCPRMLKTSADVIDILCNSQDGLLRTKTLSQMIAIKAVENFWQHQWESLGIIYEMTESWGRAKVADSQDLKDFCRDTMQLSDNLFDQYSVFASAIDLAQPIKQEDGLKAEPQDKRIGEELMKYPSEIMHAMVKWLRLRDEYLMGTSVNLIKKVLSRLTDLKMAVAQEPASFLEQVLINGSSAKTNLNPQEKAEIRRALETNLGRPLDALIEESRELSDTLSDQRRKPTSGTKKSRTVPIDLEKWRSKASGYTAAVEVSDDELPDSDLEHQLLSVSRSAELMKKLPSSIAANSASDLPRDRKASLLPTRGPQPLKATRPTKPSISSDAERALFREKREKEKEAKRKRDAEALALVKKKKAAVGIAGQTLGQGSGLGSIGVKGKDHAPKSSGMMVSSASESMSDSEDSDLDKELFGAASKASNVSSRLLDTDMVKALNFKVKGPIKKTRQARSAKDMRARLAPDLTSLHKTILGWDFFHEGDFPPGSVRNDYSIVSNTFKTSTDYQNTFEPLLILEAWQGFLKTKEDGAFKPFEVRIANRMTVDSFLELSTTMPMSEGREQGISEADVILLSKCQSPALEPQQPHCLTRAQKISRKKGTMEITYRVNAGNALAASMAPNATLYGVKITSMTPLEREYGALLGLKYFDLCDEVIRARPSPLLKYSEKQLSGFIANYNINIAQAKAVKSAMDNDAFTLIQGPPGSGKTKTIVAIVGALLTGQFGDKGLPIGRPRGGVQRNGTGSAAKKLLVCAPSNAAVDELVMRFKQGVKSVNGNWQKLSVIRLGRSDAINANVQDVTLEELVNAKLNIDTGKKNGEGDQVHTIMMSHKVACDEYNNLRDKVDQLKAAGKQISPDQDRQFELLKRKKQQLSNQIDLARDSGDAAARNAELNRRHLQQEILNSAHVICATLSGSGHEMFQSLNIEFETVIIDEAAQSVELSALIPLKYGCSKCILVGDPKQLPPTVLSREAARFQYEQSLFVRIQTNHSKDVHLLDTQYRMHPEISSFPSKSFYDSKLLDGPGMAELTRRPWHQSKILGPYRFFDVHGQHQSAPKGHSLINVAEIEVALRLFDRLTADSKGYDFKGKIGIITPYKSQLRELRFRFAQTHSDSVLSSVEFNTTDAFQGRESEVIIFSCVRASPVGGIGFLRDVRRMNVGITRAKSSLWILGNSQSLMKGDFWRRLIQDAKSRDLYAGGDLVTLLQRPLAQVDSKFQLPSKPSAPKIASPEKDLDVDMPDAPILGNMTVASRLTSITKSPADVVMTDEDDVKSFNPSGGHNGLNIKACCQKCGSIEHFTGRCDQITDEDNCHRCGHRGHKKSTCTTPRCMTCGIFGHHERTCTNSLCLSDQERHRVTKQEAGHREILQNISDTRRKQQLGEHGMQIPIVREFSTSHTQTGDAQPQRVVGEKRKREASFSAPAGAPKGPKLSGNPSRSGQPNPSLAPRDSHRLLAATLNGNPPRLHQNQSVGSHNARMAGSMVGDSCRPNYSSVTKPASVEVNTHQRDGEEISGLGAVRDPGSQSRPESTSQIIRQEGEAGGPASRPPAPPLSNVKPPRRKKEVDPFIRPKKRP